MPFFGERERAQFSAVGRRFLTGSVNARATVVEFEPVIAALQPVADALAQAGAERGELFAVPEAFYDGGGLGTWLAIRRLEVLYLLRAGDEEGSSSIWA